MDIQNGIKPMDIVTEAFNICPCPSCGDWHRDFVLAKLILFWSASLAGKNPKVPTRDEIFSSCCKTLHSGDITILSPTEGHTSWRNG
jgi:hypothetical protein